MLIMWNSMTRLSVICLLSALSSPVVLAATATETDHGASALQAQLPDVHERILQIPMDDPKNNPAVMLQTTVYTPDGAGPFPLAILNHGSAAGAPRDQARARLSFASVYFLSRGYAVVQPMMRGYAGSSGVQPANGCDIVATSLANAQDIRRVIDYMGRQPAIDASRVVVAGQSYGGYNTLALGTLNLPAVKGLVNFNGTMLSPTCSDDLQRTVNAVGYYGARTQTPSIWFYGSNDHLIKEETWRAAYSRYTGLGGKATLVALGNFLDDSHNFLGHQESMAVMTPPLDTFLRQIGMPSAVRFSGFLPMASPSSAGNGAAAMNAFSNSGGVPPPSHFAALNDVKAVPVTADLKAEYQHFLASPKPRVFMIGDRGVSVISGGINPLKRGLDNCQQRGVKCWPYAIDDDVVWVRPVLTPIPPPSGFADIHDVDAVPINESSREQYQKFLALPLPRVFVIGKNIVAVATGGLDPLGKVLQNCAQQQIQCWPYAVDNQVVWVNPRLTPLPRASGFADLYDVEAVPLQSTAAKDAYRAFLKQPLPRVFMLSRDGRIYSNHGGIDPLGYVAANCKKLDKVCSPYAVDNQVVWSPQRDFLPPSHFADIRDVEAVPYVSRAGRASYAKFLTLPNPRAFVLAPDGALGMASGDGALARATSQCQGSRQLHQGCAAYALDDDVVWFAH